MNDTGQKILEKIKEAKIMPKPRWEFLLKNYVMWAIFGISIIIGSLATSVIIFMTIYTDWHYHLSHQNPIKELLISLPSFWLAILLIFSAIAFYNIKYTKKGYKYNALVILAASIILSIIVGSAVYALGGAEKLEEIFFQRFPFYREIIKYRGRMMLDPAHGRIAGIVVEVNENLVKIQDFRGQIWEIVTSTQEFVPGQRVYLIGILPPNQKFETQMIKPWFMPHRPPMLNDPCLASQVCPLPLKPERKF